MSALMAPNAKCRDVNFESALRGVNGHTADVANVTFVTLKATSAIPYRTVPEHRPRDSFAPSPRSQVCGEMK
jgi:hypothetical protein